MLKFVVGPGQIVISNWATSKFRYFRHIWLARGLIFHTYIKLQTRFECCCSLWLASGSSSQPLSLFDNLPLTSIFNVMWQWRMDGVGRNWSRICSAHSIGLARHASNFNFWNPTGICRTCVLQAQIWENTTAFIKVVLHIIGLIFLQHKPDDTSSGQTCFYAAI